MCLDLLHQLFRCLWRYSVITSLSSTLSFKPTLCRILHTMIFSQLFYYNIRDSRIVDLMLFFICPFLVHANFKATNQRMTSKLFEDVVSYTAVRGCFQHRIPLCSSTSARRTKTVFTTTP